MASTVKLIKTENDIRDGITSLKQSCKYMRKVYSVTGDPPLRRSRGGFGGLARIVVGQQLSVASANAIWNRLESHVKPFNPEKFISISVEEFRSLGLSKPKVQTLQSVSRAVLDGQLNFNSLARKSDEMVKQQLVAIHGIGPWTADIYLMFCLGRADSWAPGDLALQYAAGEALGLDVKPGTTQLEEIAEAWRPWRSVAARLLWVYYGEIKKKNLATPL